MTANTIFWETEPATPEQRKHNLIVALLKGCEIPVTEQHVQCIEGAIAALKRTEPMTHYVNATVQFV